MQKCNENAANRYSYVGEVYNVGERKRKEEILNSLPTEWSDLHKKGYIHIHDLDAYGLTYNCLTFNLLKDNNYIIQDKTHVGMYVLTQNALFLIKNINKINKTNRNECRDKEDNVYEN